MATEGYDVTEVDSNDHAAVMMYSKTRRYVVETCPRQILKATGFECPPQHLLGLRQLELAIREGENLKPYRSKHVVNGSLRDGLLDYWGIHHFHLGTTLMRDGFIERTDQLLFCLISNEYACFIKVAAHDSDPWAKKDLVETIHLNWPDAIRSYLLPNVSGLSPEISDEDRKALRAAKVATFLDMQDGAVYCEPEFGYTSGGLHIRDLRWADHIHRIAGKIEGRVTKDWFQIAANAKLQGYHLSDVGPLVLLEAVPGIWWDLIDPRSGYWFRQYVEV